jgi:uncharacterized protein YjbJ (UPF0337 family)
MNTQQLEGQWHVLKGKIREKWGRLTDNDLTQLEGHSEQLVGKVQELYGLDREAAEKEIELWLLAQK